MERHKPKPGDWVRCIKTYRNDDNDKRRHSPGKHFSKNRTYQVSEYEELDHGLGGWVGIVADNQGEPNGAPMRWFKLVDGPERKLR